MVQGRLSAQAQENVTTLFKIHLRSTFSSKQVCEKYRLSESALQSGWPRGNFQQASTRR